MGGWPTWHRIVGRAGGCGWPGPVPASGAGPPCRAAVLHGFAQCGRIQQNEILGAEILGLRQTTRHGTFSAEWALDSPPAGPTITCMNVRQFPLSKVFPGFLNCGLMALSGHARNLSHCCGKTPPQLCLDAIQFGFALGIFVLSANLPFNLCASHTRVRLSTTGGDQTLC